MGSQRISLFRFHREPGIYFDKAGGKISADHAAFWRDLSGRDNLLRESQPEIWLWGGPDRFFSDGCLLCPAIPCILYVPLLFDRVVRKERHCDAAS